MDIERNKVMKFGAFKMKIRMVWFCTVAFSVMLWNTINGREWHMIYADFHVGDDEDGRPRRKQLIARRTCGGAEIYWQDIGRDGR